MSETLFDLPTEKSPKECDGAINLDGENYRCTMPRDHDGGCRNAAVVAVWHEPFAGRKAATRLEVLREAATAVQDYRPEDGDPGAPRWWLAWNAIARLVDIEHCQSCDRNGLLYSPDRNRFDTCKHPGVDRWEADFPQPTTREDHP